MKTAYTLKKVQKPWDILSGKGDVQLCGEGVSLDPLGDILMNSSPELLTVVAYILMTSIRSFLKECETYVDCVLCIAGDRSCGEKLAAWAGSIYTKDGEPLGIVPKDSACKKAKKKLSSLKDQPLVVDDYHLKSSGREYLDPEDMAWDLFFGGTDKSCKAGLILLTDIIPYQSCIFTYIPKSLPIPKEFTPDLLGAAVRQFLHWISKHQKKFGMDFYSKFHTVLFGLIGEDFTYDPYRYLDFILKSFLEGALKLPEKMQESICENLRKASDRSIEFQFQVRRIFSEKKIPVDMIDLLKLKEAAERLDTSPEQVRKMIQKGKLLAVKLNGKDMVLGSSIDAYLRSNKNRT